jgi:hypothetical protein
LKWRYEVPQTDVVSSTALTDHRLSPQQIVELHQLGKIGHVRGIQAKLNEVESADPANAPIAAHLRELIARFDFKRYLSALQEFAPSGQASPAPVTSSAHSASSP